MSQNLIIFFSENAYHQIPQLDSEIKNLSAPKLNAKTRFKNRTLPESSSLPNEIKRIDAKNGAIIYVVGTAHLSNNSNNQVFDIISKVQPDRVMVELCNERRGLMFASEKTLMESGDVSWEDITTMVKQKGIGAAIVQLSLLGATDQVHFITHY